MAGLATAAARKVIEARVTAIKAAEAADQVYRDARDTLKAAIKADGQYANQVARRADYLLREAIRDECPPDYEPEQIWGRNTLGGNAQIKCRRKA